MNYAYKVYIFLLLLHILFGCCRKNNNISTEKESLTTIATNDIVNETDTGRTITLSPTPFNLNEVKKIFEYYATSGVIPDSENKIFKKPADKGFFGGYSFTTLNGNLVGALTVYASSHPWSYYNDTDKFIEICTISNEILLWNNIRVGMDINKLNELLGDPQIESDDYLVYKRDNNLIVIFKHDGARIVWLRVGYYIDEVCDNITTQWQILVNDCFL